MTFGEAITGVSDTMLYSQRTAVAKAAAPQAGYCGQDLDLALIMADASASGRAFATSEMRLAVLTPLD